MLRRFFENALEDYAEERDHPANNGTSRLSPHLHFGEISPLRVWAACAGRRSAASKAFLRQMGWREFAHHPLYHFPNTACEPLRPQFARFPWRHDPKRLRAWQRGLTGYPIVDAGLRGLLYWHSVHPLHQLVFEGMLRGIADAAEDPSGKL